METSASIFISKMEIENYLESVGNQLSSSGIISCDTHCRFLFVKQVLKNLKIESSSCLCSTLSTGPRRDTIMNAFRTLKR